MKRIIALLLLLPLFTYSMDKSWIPAYLESIKTPAEKLKDQEEKRKQATTELKEYISYGNTDVNNFKRLLQEGADINMRPFGKSLLTYTARKGMADIVKLLIISHGVDINSIDEFGQSPLANAILSKNINTIIFLLDAGANPNFIDRYGDNTLMIAAYNNNLDATRLLINHIKKLLSAAFEQEVVCRTSYLNLLPTDLRELTLRYLQNNLYKFVNRVNYKGNTALIFATANQNAEMVKLLLANGADVSIKNKDRKTALNVAKEKGNQEIIKLLSDAQAKQQSQDTP